MKNITQNNFVKKTHKVKTTILLKEIFKKRFQFSSHQSNLIKFKLKKSSDSQNKTDLAFSEKWKKYKKKLNKSETYTNLEFQRKWFLKLYGFNRKNLAKKVSKSSIILDAGCGLGEKSAWLASMNPNSIVLGVDLSETPEIAASKYNKTHKNLFFFKGDISNLPIKKNKIDFIICDQVIMHTSDPSKTFKHLSQLLTPSNGELCCYWYAKKALPRELLDDYFREHVKTLTFDQLWELSKGLTLLGKNLSKIKVKIDVPKIEALGIKKQRIDLQRFVYWNFIKCFWNEDLGKKTSDLINFDWYSPVNAKRFSGKEIKKEVTKNKLSTIYFHSEPACFSGRFKRIKSLRKK